jgi:DNA polymerase-1
LRERRPDYLAVAFDLPGRTFRHDLDPAYKATRKPTPDDLRWQLPVVRTVLEAMGVPALEAEGFEADDVIGTAARQAEARGHEVFLVANDKDLEQLLGDRVRMLNPKTGVVTGPGELREKRGIGPEQVVAVLALAGDPSDNVPGVPGVGPKTAARLVARYGTLEKVLASAPIIGGRMGQKLRVAEADVLRCRELVTLRTDVPLRVDFEACRVGPPDREALAGVFRRLGFRTLAASVEAGR